MPPSSGDKLGHYEIVAPLGAGGMGEVYRAHDPRLKRDVAIKVSAAQFSERFEREAHAIAALNHSNSPNWPAQAVYSLSGHASSPFHAEPAQPKFRPRHD